MQGVHSGVSAAAHVPVRNWLALHVLTHAVHCRFADAWHADVSYSAALHVVHAAQWVLEVPPHVPATYEPAGQSAMQGAQTGDAVEEQVPVR